jgi:hypothetical protein
MELIEATSRTSNDREESEQRKDKGFWMRQVRRQNRLGFNPTQQRNGYEFLDSELFRDRKTKKHLHPVLLNFLCSNFENKKSLRSMRK